MARNMAGGGRGSGRAVEMLKTQAEGMMTRLQAIRARISELQETRAGPAYRAEESHSRGQTSNRHETHPGVMAAVVDGESCMGCGICVDLCEEGAISFRKDFPLVVVDAKLCTGCGACIDDCPNEAILFPGARGVSY